MLRGRAEGSLLNDTNTIMAHISKFMVGQELDLIIHIVKQNARA